MHDARCTMHNADAGRATGDGRRATRGGRRAEATGLLAAGDGRRRQAWLRGNVAPELQFRRTGIAELALVQSR
jgi:hypothetical protein